MYLPSFMWIDKIPFKLSSGQAYPSKKHIFGHVTSLIGWNVTAAYSKTFPKATAYTYQIWKESAQRSQSNKENKMWRSRSRFPPIHKQAALAGSLNISQHPPNVSNIYIRRAFTAKHLTDFLYIPVAHNIIKSLYKRCFLFCMKHEKHEST